MRDAEPQSSATGTLGILANNAALRKGVLDAAGITVDATYSFKTALVRYNPAPLAKLAAIEGLELCTEPEQHTPAAGGAGKLQQRASPS